MNPRLSMKVGVRPPPSMCHGGAIKGDGLRRQWVGLLAAPFLFLAASCTARDPAIGRVTHALTCSPGQHEECEVQDRVRICECVDDPPTPPPQTPATCPFISKGPPNLTAGTSFQGMSL
jgi:hypothetical protein